MSTFDKSATTYTIYTIMFLGSLQTKFKSPAAFACLAPASLHPAPSYGFQAFS